MANVKINIDGKDLEVPQGTLIIEAAKLAGAAVPHYCYHPALGNPGNCRLCMVEVEGMPKLMVSCRLGAAEGMKVRTNSPNVKRAQASSLELHLVNHPLDCPVCDQAGECGLQDYYMSAGLYPSAVREDKKHKDKRIDIGEHVMLDQERCILCTRCTRFLDKVTGTSELGIFGRGDREVLAPYPGQRVDNAYSGNIVDVCPVGALTDKDFRFKVRVWYLKRKPSVCSGCSRGCSIDIHVNSRLWHTGGERVARYKPRFNAQVNGYWLCDEGRYGFEFHDKDRLSKLRRKAAEGHERLEWAPGLKRLSEELGALVQAKGGKGLGVVLSGKLSNEDAFLARKFFAETLGAGRILIGPSPEQLGEEDKMLRRKEKVPNLKGAESLGFGSKVQDASWDQLKKGIESGELWGLYVVDRDPVKVWGAAVTAALVSKLSFVAYQGSNAGGFASLAQWILPASTHGEEEGSFTNFEGHVQRYAPAMGPLGQSRSDWEIWRDLNLALGGDFHAGSAAEVFDQLCAQEPAFAGLSWAALGAEGRRMGRAPGEPAAV